MSNLILISLLNILGVFTGLTNSVSVLKYKFEPFINNKSFINAWLLHKLYLVKGLRLVSLYFILHNQHGSELWYTTILNTFIEQINQTLLRCFDISSQNSCNLSGLDAFQFGSFATCFAILCW